MSGVKRERLGGGSEDGAGELTADQLVVLSMYANPVPNNEVISSFGHGSILIIDACRPSVIGQFLNCSEG